LRFAKDLLNHECSLKINLELVISEIIFLNISTIYNKCIA